MSKSQVALLPFFVAVESDRASQPKNKINNIDSIILPLESTNENFSGSDSNSASRDVLQLRNPLRGSMVDALVGHINDKEAKNRAQAAEALGELGDGALPALSILLKALRDPACSVQYFAAQSLGLIIAGAKCKLPPSISPERASAELLLLLARSGSLAINSPGHAAFRALAKLGARYPEKVLPQIVSELASDSDNVQRGIGEALLGIAASHPQLVASYLNRATASDHKTLALHASKLESELFGQSLAKANSQ